MPRWKVVGAKHPEERAARAQFLCSRSGVGDVGCRFAAEGGEERMPRRNLKRGRRSAVHPVDGLIFIAVLGMANGSK